MLFTAFAVLILILEFGHYDGDTNTFLANFGKLHEILSGKALECFFTTYANLILEFGHYDGDTSTFLAKIKNNF